MHFIVPLFVSAFLLYFSLTLASMGAPIVQVVTTNEILENVAYQADADDQGIGGKSDSDTEDTATISFNTVRPNFL